MNDYKAAITASNKALSAFKNGFNAGESDISAMDLACMFALLSEIYSVQNQPKQMEQCDNSITGLAITANMIEGYFHELLTPFVLKSLKRSLETMNDQNSNAIHQLIHNIEEKLTKD